MSTWVSDQVALINQGALGGLAIAGVAGGPLLPRATEYRGIIKVIRYSFEAATPNPLPGFPAGSFTAGDTLVLAQLNDPDIRIYMGRTYVTTAFGAGTTLSVGKLDLNYAPNTDPVHYLAATSIAATGMLELNLNMTEQVGTSPIGDQTPGQAIPEFGSAPIWITGTLAGATIGTTGIMQGFIFIVEEGN